MTEGFRVLNNICRSSSCIYNVVFVMFLSLSFILLSSRVKIEKNGWFIENTFWQQRAQQKREGNLALEQTQDKRTVDGLFTFHVLWFDLSFRFLKRQVSLKTTFQFSPKQITQKNIMTRDFKILICSGLVQMITLKYFFFSFLGEPSYN